MPTDTPLQRRAYWGGCLAEAGQGIELAEHADGAATVALLEFRNEGGGDTGYTGGDSEPGISQYFLQQRRGLVLLVTNFGKAPDSERRFGSYRAVRLDAGQDGLRIAFG